ncbi:MAG: NADH-quinone oxidoreductase subunit NuoE [Bacillota bacterium]|nr:NADH-quinone oxidoreductase subunit NuoE [Bacillota bacterium]
MSEERSFERTALDEILSHYEGQPGALIPVLQQAQDAYGYLPRPVIAAIAERLRLPAARIYGVATFYAQFHLKPRGRHIVRVCLGTACHVRGGERIAEQLAESLGVAVGGTTEDRLFTLEKVACLGACGLAPAMVVDGTTYGRLTPKAALNVIERYRREPAEVATQGGQAQDIGPSSQRGRSA